MENRIVCPLCRCDDTVNVYRGPIRAGTTGTYEDGYEVHSCKFCGVLHLLPKPTIRYDRSEYRQSYNSSSRVEDYLALHDTTQSRFMDVIDQPLRGKTIADFGCGGGSLLDYLKGIAGETIAIEPYIGYHESLIARGHKVYQYGSDMISDENSPALDIAISQHVIEHVDDPVAYLKEIASALKSEGVLYLATPNSEDILRKAIPDSFEPFYFRTAHLWYFNRKSITWAFEAAGYRKIRVGFRQNYGMGNFISWMRDRCPAGDVKNELLDDRIDRAWRDFLVSTESSDELIVKATV